MTPFQIKMYSDLTFWQAQLGLLPDHLIPQAHSMTHLSLLSPHFSLEELSPSDTPPEEAMRRLQRLCVEVLEPIRSVVGCPLRVTSGYRTPEHNRRIGGSRHSQHLRGEAADVVPLGIDPEVAMERIAEIIQDIPAGQIIIYRSGFLHISIDPGSSPRRQMLRSMASGGSGGPYSPWKPE